MNSKGRVLALDVGIKSCGFAITDQNQKIVFGLENTFFKALDFNFVFNHLKTIVFPKYSDISLILVGMPTLFSGKKTETSKMIESFGQDLELFLKQNNSLIKVQFFDENNSTKLAYQKMDMQSLKKKNQKAKKDVYSAAIFLEDYIMNHSL